MARRLVRTKFQRRPKTGPRNCKPQEKYESLIWDRVKGKPAGEVPGTIPIGPGPTATTMVLCPRPYTGHDPTVVHDAGADKMWTVEGPVIRPITSEGKYIIYTKKGENGREIVYRG